MSTKSSFASWIKAFRLRTLFLSLSGILLGNGLAVQTGLFQTITFVLSICTALFLQILSNLANDYGDSIHGADHAGRKGPSRAVQSGLISANQMKKGMLILAILSLISGIALLLYAREAIGLKSVLLLFGIGLAAIAAAIYYTNGKKPYGYMGLGDISVFIFFGIISVCGGYYLHTGFLESSLILPACAIGFLSTAVLNVNNMRDIDSDIQAGKNSIPVRIGWKNAKRYHTFLLVSAMVCIQLFMKTEGHVTGPYQVLYPLFFVHIAQVWRKKNKAELDPMLKQLSIGTFVWVLLILISL